MVKVLVFAAAVLALLVLGVIVVPPFLTPGNPAPAVSSLQSTSPRPSSIPAPQHGANVSSQASGTGSPDPQAPLPVLYPGVHWESLKRAELVFPTDQGAVQVKGDYVESVILENYPQGFVTYYKLELPDRGWRLIDSAGGIGDEWYGYEKNGHYFAFGVRRLSGRLEKYRVVVQHD